MNWVVITALIAVCGAAKLDRTYLPPSSADSAGGSQESLQAPLTKSSDQGQITSGLPTGSYTNNFGGVVVDAASPGTRVSAEADQSALGGPRPSYGSTDSKVGDAAFRGSVAGFRDTPSFGSASGQFDGHGQNFASNGQIDTHAGHFSSNGQEKNGQSSHAGQFSSNRFANQGFQDFENKSERPQAAKDRNSNILALSNDVNTDSYSYGFETDNGIAVGENGVAVNGVQAEGGYSYQGDDGQVYKVTYTADEGGYRPQGVHLPTPPPIPDEILKSLEQNAKEEAAGLVDDGSYDAQKYNTDGDYTHDNSGNIQYNGAQLSQFGKRPESDATTGGTFINQNGQEFGKTGSGSNGNNDHSSFNGQFGTGSNVQNAQFNGHRNPGQSGIVASSNTHSTFGQLGQGSGNQFGWDTASVQHGDTSSHGGISSQPLSGQQENTGHTFSHNKGKQFSSLPEQSGFGNQDQIGSQFNQQTSAQNQQSPSSQLGLNSFGQNSGSPPLHSQVDHPQFGSSFKPQGSEAFSGASLNQDQDKQDFGKPFPQTFSGQNFNRPSVNFNSNRFAQANKFGSAANRFPQASGQLDSINEYLPPVIANEQPQTEKLGFAAGFDRSNSGSASSGFSSNVGQKLENKDKVPDFVDLNVPKPGFSSASASASVGQPASQPQPAEPINAFDTSKLQFNANKFTQQQATQILQANEFELRNPANSNINQQQSGPLIQKFPDLSSKPTPIPETELTTPLEPNEISTSQGSQFPSQTMASFSAFDSKPASNNQASPQFGFQGNSAFGQESTSQTLSPSFPTLAPQSTNTQFGTASTQSGFHTSVGNRPQNSNDKPQFPQNTFVQKQPSFNQGSDNSYYYNQPNKPFGAPVRPQGSRFPSLPSYQLNGLTAQTQNFNQQNFQSSPKFPVSQSLGPVSPTSPTQFAQNQGYNGITQAAISPFPSAAPTPSSQFGSTHNSHFGSRPNFNQQPSFGNQVQPSKPFNQQSTFSSVGQQNRPTLSQQGQSQSAFPLRPTTQFAQKPTPSIPHVQAQSGVTENTPGSSDGSSQQQLTMTQQYQGTIYEYNKPAEVLPAPTETDSSSSQAIDSGVISESGQTQENQLHTQQNSKPGEPSKLGSQNNKPFGNSDSTTQLDQHSQTSHNQASHQTGIQFGSQPINQVNPLLNNIQFGQTAQPGAKPEKPSRVSTVSSPFGQTQSISDTASSLQLNTQGSQTGAFKPFGNGVASQGGSSFGSKPQFGSPTTQSITQTTQSFGSSQTSQPSRGSMQSQFNSQTFGNASSGQNSGYFYTGNPKPQFQGAEISNPFNQNAQLGRPQSGSNQFNHNSQNANNQFGHNSQSNSLPTGSFNQQSSQSQFNSASKPQFGIPSQTQYNQNTKTQLSQKEPNSPIQPLGQPLFGQSTASSQAVAFGQASASSSASSSPQQPQYKPFGQNKPQSLNTNSHDQSGQSSLQTFKPFGSNTQEPTDSKPSGALNSKPFGVNAQSAEASKPLFNSPCCQGSKDSTPAQSTERPSQAFQGTQGFNTQTFAGKGEVFGGPRQPARFDDQTGYHY